MAVYTVHRPPPRKYEGVPDPERFVFVRDGFSFWAFLFGPLWMLRHRMWLVLFGYIAVMAMLAVALQFAGVTGGVRTFVMILTMFLVGMEAGSLRRFTLGRGRWQPVGVVVGDDRDTAERRFFDGWIQSGGGQGAWVGGEAMPTAAAVRPTPPFPPRPAAASDVIGLFPQPGAPR